MRYKTMTLGISVIRFPVEVRAKPSINLLIEVAPDSREVELLAEAFGFDAPDPDRRNKSDRARWRRRSRRRICRPIRRSERRRETRC
jgi:hypothetical protein